MSFNQPNRDSPGSLHDVVSNTDGPSIDRISNDHKYDSGDVEGLHLEKKVTITDPVFGEILEDGPQYRNVGWIGSTILMMKTQIGIGVLTIPRALDILGLVPGIITIIIVAIISTWSNYTVGRFKLRHPEVYGIDDAGYIMFGRVGKEILSTVFTLYWVFVSGSANLGVSIGLNVISGHATCTAVFVAVAAIVAWVLTSVPTLSKMSWLAAAGAASIMTAILTVTISVGVQDRPAAAPQTGPFIPDVKMVGNPTFAEMMQAVAMIIFAFSGTPAFFPIAAEMRNPQHYTRAMLICQAVVTTIYLVIGIVVYVFCGSYVASPALGSAGPLMAQVCYGLALPGLLVTQMIVSHFPAKMLMVRMLKGSKHLSTNTVTHWVTWLSCTLAVVLAAYIIASAVPNFGSLIALIGALLGPVICFLPMGAMWLHDNWTKDKTQRNWRWWFMVGWSVFVILAGLFCMFGGTYGAVMGLKKDYSGDGGASPWSCADNSVSS